MGMFGAVFAWPADVLAFPSRLWWFTLSPGSFMLSIFALACVKHSNPGFKTSLQKPTAVATGMALFYCSLWSSFDMKGDAEKTSVTKAESPKTICFHINRIYIYIYTYMTLGLYVKDWLFKKCQIPHNLKTPLNSHSVLTHLSSSAFVCFFLDKVLTLLLILTKGRDCICWKLLLECPKALWEVNSNEVKNSCPTPIKNKLAHSSNIKFIKRNTTDCNCVLGTKTFTNPAVFAAVIVFLKHWTIDGTGKLWVWTIEFWN